MKTAVLGATGLVGRTMLRLLESRDWLGAEPVALASARGAGTRIPFRDTEIVCREVAPDAFAGVDVALFSAGGGPSRTWAPRAAAAGAWVVDNSSAWRMDPDVPLIVPEINGDLAPVLAPQGGAARTGGIIANPNCSTIQIVMAVAALDDLFLVREAHVTTLQAVSGAGQAAVDELHRQESDPDGDHAAGPFPRTIARNALPAIGAALPDGSYEEEAKVVREMRKILARGPDLKVSCTATRVPVITGHGAAIRVVCERPVDTEAAVEALAARPGVTVLADPHAFHTPREAAGRNDVFIGRLRRDPEDAHALLMWVVADNLLKGAAWNAVQIAARLAGATR